MNIEDLQKAIPIIKEYNTICNNISVLDSELKKIEEKKNKLIKELKEVEQKEIKLVEFLKEKYGYVDYNEILQYVINNT